MQIKETSINGVISFDGSHVGRLQDLDFQTPHPHGQESLLSLGGMTYELLGHKQRLFHSLEQAEFSRLDYAVLEGYLKAHGDSDRCFCSHETARKKRLAVVEAAMGLLAGRACTVWAGSRKGILSGICHHSVRYVLVLEAL